MGVPLGDAEDYISRHMTGTVNDCFHHINATVIVYKALPTHTLCMTLEADAVGVTCHASFASAMPACCQNPQTEEA